jgi:replicative DNA helicase
MSTARTREPFADQGRDFSRLFDRQPPHAIEAECALLGSMILDWRVIGEVIQILNGAEDFYRQANANIYQVLVDQYDQQQSGDMVQLNQAMRDRGLLEQVGGTEYLIELAQSVPSAESSAHYARIVRDKAILRSLITACGKALETAYTSPEDARSQLEEVEKEIFALSRNRYTGGITDLKTLLQEAFDKITSRDGEGLTGLDCGFHDLNDRLNGLHRGEMIIVAARPSMGKTAFAMNIAEHIALMHRKPVGVFSMEMGKEQLAMRMLASRSGVDSERIRRNTISDDDANRLARTVGELSEAPIFIDDSPGLTMMTLRAKARRMSADHNLEVIVIDYMQLMSGSGTGRGESNRQQEVSEISRGIKALARELNIPVICLSQLNRGAEGREGHRPRLSDLRESGSIEQDADVVLLLHREDYYRQKNEEEFTPTNIADVIIAKQRNGPTDTINLHFDGPRTRFHDLDTRHTPPPGMAGGESAF